MDSTRPRKRKAGPIRMDYVFRRTSTDSRLRASTSLSTSSMSSANSNLSSLSDLETDSEAASETSSISSGVSEDGDPERLVVAFPDFADEEPPDQEFAFNGYVRDFINGVGVESSCDNSNNDILSPSNRSNPLGLHVSSLHNGQTPPISPHPHLMQQHSSATSASPHPYMANYNMPHEPTAAPPPPLMGSSHIGLNALQQQPQHQHQQQPQQSINGNIIYNAPIQQTNSNGIVNNIINNPSMVTSQQQSTSNSYHIQATQQQIQVNIQQQQHIQHNDINDAQEISRILQQCHNGNIISSSSAAIAGADSSVDNIKLDPEQALMPPPSSLLSSSTNNASFDALKRETSLNSFSSVAAFSTTTSPFVTAFSNHINHNNSGSLQPALLPPVQLTEEQKELARKHNQDLRAQVFRDIRKPGRNYSQLLEHLNLIKGDLDMKSNFIQMCIIESLRFRRKQMVNTIQEWWDKKQQQLQATS